MILPPQVAILGVGRIHEMAVVKDGAVAPASVLPLSLVVDHRLIDGVYACKFLARFMELISQPGPVRRCHRPHRAKRGFRQGACARLSARRAIARRAPSAASSRHGGIMQGRPALLERQLSLCVSRAVVLLENCCCSEPSVLRPESLCLYLSKILIFNWQNHMQEVENAIHASGSSLSL